jgi:hypothetical protein
MVMHFNRIIEAHPDVKIVISSTWRHSYTHGVYSDFAGLVALLVARGLEGDVIGHTPFPVGGSNWRTRGEEIRMYLTEHPEVEHYLILDDDKDVGLEPDLRPHWIQTSGASGLKDSQVGRAIKMLRKPEEAS